MRPHFEIRREQFTLQAHFASPVFDLFKEFPDLVHHLFRELASHGLRLSDIKLDSAAESLGEVNLRISWTDLGVARLFLDRIELMSEYPPFITLREGALVSDLLGAVATYRPDVSFRTFAVTQEVHGALDSPVKDFLCRFSAEAPKTLGPKIGSGTVFYFGAAENRFAGSMALDFSRSIEGGIFLKLVVMYDSSQVRAADLITVSRLQLFTLIDELGLDLAGD